MGDIKGFLKVKRQIAQYRAVCERIKDFREVSVLRSDEHSREQASRCMDCGTPFCHWGCSIGNYIPEWNDFVFKSQWKIAFQLLNATNNLPEITGRICPAPCEYACVLGINDEPVTIRENELAIIEYAFKNDLIKPQPPKKRSGERVAIIGSGPAGLSCADQLNKAGHSIVVFEKDDKVGGILRYGIPDFKLEKWVLDRRIKILKKEGIEFRRNVNIVNILNADSRKSNTDGRRFYLRVSACPEWGYSAKCNFGIPKKYRSKNYIRDNPRKSALKDVLLKERFNAICLTGGCRVPRDLRIEGRDLNGIYFAMDYLIQANRRIAGEKISSHKLIDARGKQVVVIGGGDTGADCVGTAHRQQASCVIQIELLPQPPECRPEDFPWPKYPLILKTSTSHEEGGEQKWQVLTKKFVGKNGQIEKLSCVRVDFSNKDGKGCPIMQEIPGSEFEIEADLVILALGFLHPEKKGLIAGLGVELDSCGNVKTKENFMTKVLGVFSAGDMHRGQSLIVWAISEGRRAAYFIDKYLMGASHLPVM